MALRFNNDSGGYELRNELFEGSNTQRVSPDSKIEVKYMHQFHLVPLMKSGF